MKKKRKSVSYAKWGYIFILPFFITYLIFSLIPLVDTVRFSFFEYYRSGIKEIGPNFVGLANYAKLFQGGDIWIYFKNTMIMWVMGFIPQILVSLLLAAWFSNPSLRLKGQRFFKTVIYLPNLIMASAFAMLFFTLFADGGPINAMLMQSGILKQAYSFFSHAWSARTLVAVLNFLMWFGNTTILLMAGMMGIDSSLYEAAEVDGATSSQIFRKITLPLLRPILIYVMITSLIGGMQMFDVPQILTNGQGNPDRTSMTLIMFLNNHLKSKNYGMAGTLSVYLFIVSAILCFIVYRMTNDSDPDGSKAAAKRAAKEARRKKKEAAK